MAQIPIQSGVRVEGGGFRKSYPTNLYHKVLASGVSQGQLVSERGARTLATGPGADRGGIVWAGVHYRVMGAKLCSIAADGTVTQLATISNDGLPCRFTFSFDRLAIGSAEALYYWMGGVLTQVTDIDLRPVLDVVWVDGYFASTDGESVVVTELNDPTSVDPLKYGSAETNPDPITGLENLREELAVIGRHTIQFFQNVGGTGFPFRNVRGAMIPYGCISAQAKCQIVGTLAFVGGGEDDPLGVYLVAQGSAVRISDEEIDAMLAECEDETAISLEARSFGDEVHLYVHAGNTSAALVMRGSQEADAGLWRFLHTDGGRYLPRNALWFRGAHYVANEATVGMLDETISAHFGTEAGWSFDAGMLYADGQGVILHEIEIVGQFPASGSVVFFSMTRDGEAWSNEIARHLTGRRGERCIWGPHVRCGSMAGLRFRGRGKVAISRCDARGEALAA